MIKDKVLLKVRNVKKYFHTPSGVINAIDDVSFDVRQGEIIGLIGESGSGKTTVGRCLIRLYDGFSGFVSLDGQAISGNKLSRRKKMFLNQNMQMIFQDPHASLNGQQNIYTILKEPLIVNNIMKNEYKDFFKDWDKVTSNFKYEFSEELRKIELDTITYHANQAEILLKEWLNLFKRIKFRYLDVENDFNQYFAYKLSCQEREANVINKIFKNNSRILDFYFEKQKNFRNNEIIEIEKQLKVKREFYEETIKKSKLTDFELRKHNLLTRKKQELKVLTKTKEETLKNHTSVLNSYVIEFKNAAVSSLEKARSKENYFDYNKEIKNHIIANQIHSIIKKNKTKLIFLSSEEMDNFVNEIKKYGEEFAHKLSKFDDKLKEKDYKKIIKNEITSSFKFNFDKYVEKSENVKLRLKNKIKELKKEIGIIDWTFSTDRHASRIKNDEDIEIALKDFLDLKKIYDKECVEYANSYQKRMDNYRAQMIKQHEKLNAIRSELDKINEEFKIKHKEFIEGLKHHLKIKGESTKQINNHINIFENRVKLKDETLKAFNFEIDVLKRDLTKLKHLVGIKKSLLSKKYIKKILMNEKIYKALEDVGLLRQFAWRYPHEFSGGQRQRIVITRALISNPKIIIADEPIASLDVSIQAQVVNILKELCERKNVSLIFIAHDLSMVEYIADKILIMHLGKIVEFGKTEEIYANPIHPYTINLFKSVPKISNANDKFESSNFELNYLEEQKRDDAYVDFFELNKDHILYSTKEQFREWAKQEPKISIYSKSSKL